MPTDTVEAMRWLVPQLLKDLFEATFPMLASMKHQDTTTLAAATNTFSVDCGLPSVSCEVVEKGVTTGGATPWWNQILPSISVSINVGKEQRDYLGGMLVCISRQTTYFQTDCHRDPGEGDQINLQGNTISR